MWRPFVFAAAGLLLLAFKSSMAAQTRVPCETGKGEWKQCSDSDSGVSFKLPKHWYVGEVTRWNDERSTTLDLLGPKKARTRLYFTIIKKTDRITPEEIEKWLPAYVDQKVNDRQREGLKNYRVRPQSYEHFWIGGHPALSYVADYTEGKRNMVEYITWVRSSALMAEFFSRMPASDLNQFRKLFDPIFGTLR